MRLVVVPAVELQDGLVGELHVGHFLLKPFPLVPVPDRVVGSQLGAQADLAFNSSGVDRDMPQFEASWVLRHVPDFLVGPPHCDRRLIQGGKRGGDPAGAGRYLGQRATQRQPEGAANRKPS